MQKAIIFFFGTFLTLSFACNYFKDRKQINQHWNTGRNGDLLINAKAYDKIILHFSKPISNIKIHYGLTMVKKWSSTQYEYIVIQWPSIDGDAIKLSYTMTYKGTDVSEVTMVTVNGKSCGKTIVTDPPVKPTMKPTQHMTTKTKSTGGCTTRYDYKKALKFSLLFYEAQRSGKLPSNNRIPWRKDSCLNDGKKVGIDLSGGYYDAGDYVKFNFPQSFAITMLAWGMVEYEDGYKFAGQYQYGLDAIKWGTDYLIKCHSAPNKFWGQVGNGDIDHKTWSRANEIDESQRFCYDLTTLRPGTEVVAEAAAALAASSIVFKTHDPSYSAKLLTHAKQLFSFADKYRGNYHNSIHDAGKFYKSWSGYKDELVWASAWLYRATSESRYLTKAEAISLTSSSEFSWDNKWEGANVLLALTSGKKSYKDKAKEFCRKIKDSTPRTPKSKGPNGHGDGMVFIQKWGSTRHAANVAFLCLVYSKYDASVDYFPFARGQINMLLGDAGRSYVVGFGHNPPQKCHHSGASCPNRPATCGWYDFKSHSSNPHILYGALVGGPSDPSGGYVDKRDDFVTNEVSIDYNAGYQSALAGLLSAQQNGNC